MSNGNIARRMEGITKVDIATALAMDIFSSVLRRRATVVSGDTGTINSNIADTAAAIRSSASYCAMATDGTGSVAATVNVPVTAGSTAKTDPDSGGASRL